MDSINFLLAIATLKMDFPDELVSASFVFSVAAVNFVFASSSSFAATTAMVNNFQM